MAGRVVKGLLRLLFQPSKCVPVAAGYRHDLQATSNEHDYFPTFGFGRVIILATIWAILGALAYGFAPYDRRWHFLSLTLFLLGPLGVGEFGVVYMQRPAHGVALLWKTLYAPQPGPPCQIRDRGPVSMWEDEQRG